MESGQLRREPGWYLPTLQMGLGFLSLLVLPLALYMIFIYAPEERTMGPVQRIFYFHVGSAWNAFAMFLLVAGASAWYLWRKSPWSRQLGRSAAEVGVLFTTLTLVSGSFWARPVWNVWWTWDPRLTTTLVLWFIYVAYLLLQASDQGDGRFARLAAVFGLLGVIDIPLIHVSAILWRSIHPVIVSDLEMNMPASMVHALLVAVIALAAIGGYLLSLRLGIGWLETRLELLRQTER